MNFAYLKTRRNHLINRPAFGFWVISVIVGLSSCSSSSDPEVASNVAQESSGVETYEISTIQFQSSKMTLGNMERVPFHEVVKAKGMIDVPPENRAAVSSYFGGTVKEIRLLPGQSVKKGQELFVLENPDYVQIQQDFLEAKGQLAYLQSDYERQKNLVQDSISSQKKFLKAESDYAVTRARVASLGKKLALMSIDPSTFTIENIRTSLSVRSPINGYVTEVAISKGAYLTPSQMAVTIVNTDHVHLEMNVFEKDLGKISVGQPIRFRIQEDNSQEYEAFIYLISKTIDPEERTLGIHGHLVDEKLAERFNPGMYVEAVIYTRSEEKWALPKDALVEIEENFYVLTLQNRSETGYTFIKREVKKGLSNNSHVEILDSPGLDETTKFLLNGSFHLIKE
ncbi:membrane fusion protein, cobalt-zinc-cadmium efflux system [Cyclobacterium lianum]|uniref:Membrane fusion protein, cobalt-zinc-cadmium efflux system n=1 Tax=Cyclobacterium lianum TaxID=388280 RepID=A0A1M7LKR4_9BACT|nr:efflux RND transporter periplasmic adaptor subunit [Cyclobacterium lianum]SHM78190.1 membrane fusion protein, cobalt-zinc-cadmium efflux system [Cyclobacterium lianum]